MPALIWVYPWVGIVPLFGSQLGGPLPTRASGTEISVGNRCRILLGSTVKVLFHWNRFQYLSRLAARSRLITIRSQNLAMAGFSTGFTMLLSSTSEEKSCMVRRGARPFRLSQAKYFSHFWRLGSFFSQWQKSIKWLWLPQNVQRGSLPLESRGPRQSSGGWK